MQNPIHKVRGFYQEIVGELKKCTWPTREELRESTAVVIASVIIMSVFVAAADWACQMLIRLMTRTS